MAGAAGSLLARRWQRRGAMLQDFRYALRQLRRSPGFAAVVVATLALAIGGTTAMFSLIQGVLLRPLDYPEADRLVTLWSLNQKAGRTYAVSGPDFRDWKGQSQSFTAMARFREGRPTAVIGQAATSAWIAQVSQDFFAVMATPARAGRWLRADAHNGDWQDGGVVVVSDRFLRQHFAGDVDRALATRLKLSGRSYQVVGVMPAGFEYPVRAELWVPFLAAEDTPARSAHNYRVIGRLRPGVSLAAAQAELTGVAARLAAQYPENANKGASLIPLQERLVGSHGATLWLLFAAVVLVLLIACANIANLLLARGARRAPELAVRAALGAGRARLARQLLTESLVLATLGGLLGVVVARGLVDALLTLAPANIPRLATVTLDGWTLGFCAACTLTVCLLVGALPAAQVGRRDLVLGLRAGGRGATASRGRLRAALVVTQLAVSMVLLTGAGLLLTSLDRLAAVDPGYRPQHLLVMKATHDTGAEPAAALDFFQELRHRASSLPGVEAVSFTDSLPVDGYRSNGTYWIEGRRDPEPSDSARQNAIFRLVGPDYFSTIGIPVRSGREPDRRDVSGAPLTVVINQAMADASWPGASPLGKRIRCGWYDGTAQWMTIVGVVANARPRTLDEPIQQEMYLPAAQHATIARVLKVVARTAPDPTSLFASFRQLSRSLSAEVPVELTTAELMVADTLSAPRFRTLLLGTFALVALLLALVGVAGVMAGLVTERRTEIGVRMAIGARRAVILRHFLGRALRLALLGLGVGLLGSLACAHLLESLLFGVGPTDPLILASAGALLIAAALAAAAAPSLRAAAVSPMVALRAE
jgi:putative ABC transport system permease protein